MVTAASTDCVEIIYLPQGRCVRPCPGFHAQLITTGCRAADHPAAERVGNCAISQRQQQYVADTTPAPPRLPSLETVPASTVYVVPSSPTYYSFYDPWPYWYDPCLTGTQLIGTHISRSAFAGAIAAITTIERLLR